MTLTGKELVKLLERNGWSIARINGSHYYMVKGSQKLAVPVHAGQAIPTGLLNRLLKEAGLK